MHPIKWGSIVTLVLLLGACGPAVAPVAPTVSAPAVTPAPAATSAAAKPAAPTSVAPAAAAPATAAAPVAAAPTTASATTQQGSGGKTLTIGLAQEPKGFGVMISQIAAIEVEQSLNAYFTYRDADLKVQPWLVEKIPSIKDGDWVINADGTMVVTWKLRPNIKWSDGQPLTVEDVIFGWQVMTDKDIPAYGKSDAQKIDHIEKVDERTFKVYWKEPYVFADQGLPQLSTTARPLPTHILQQEFNTDKEKFKNDPYWTTKFVGTGPYRLVDWVPGSHITLQANPDYFLGKPKIDRVVWSFFTDTNTLVANVLSGQLDLTVTPSISLDQALTVKQQWDRSGDGSIITVPGFGWDWIGFNNHADPKFNDIRVRQALLSAIDRQQIVDTLFKGANPVGDSWLSPRHPLMTDAVKASGTTWPYDPKKAADLFAAAGWNKGPDGILTNASGEPFTVSIRTITGDKTKEDVEAIVADFWKQAGVKTDIDNQPSQTIYDPMHLFHFGWPSAFLFNYGGNPNVLAEDFRCQDIPSEANNFSGGNLANYCSQEYDAAFAEKDINQTLDVAQREQITAKLNKIWTNDLPFLPLYFKAEVAAVRKGVTGFNPSGTNEGWMATMYTWDVAR